MLKRASRLFVIVFLLNLFFVIPAWADEITEKNIHEQMVRDGQTIREAAETTTADQAILDVQNKICEQFNDSDDVKKSMGSNTIYEREPNNFDYLADTIYLGSYVVGSISPWYDLDYFKLTVNNSGTLIIVGMGVGSSNSYISSLAIGLRDINDKSLGWSQCVNTSSGRGQALSRYVTPGTYYLCVMGLPSSYDSYYYPFTGESYMILTDMSGTGGGGTTPPKVISTDPLKRATNVPVDKTFVFTYDMPIKVVNGNKIYFYDWNTFDRIYTQTRVEDRKLFIQPNNNFLGYTKYMVNVDSGGITDLSGNAPEDYYWSFTTGGNTSNTIPVSSVNLNKTSISIIEGATESLTATISPANATKKSVIWSSSNSAIAKVDSSGVVTGVNAGSATITVTTTDGNKTASCYVTVTKLNIAVVSVSLNKNSITLNKGDTETLIATINPSNATNGIISWVSNNPAVAAVDANGVVTALKTGNATISVLTADGGKTARCSVQVIEASTPSFTEWNEMTDQPTDKIWTIRFNQKLNPFTINSTTIYVAKDSTGGSKVSGISVIPGVTDAKTVLVKPPVGGWQPGETYYLIITNNVKAQNNNMLRDGVRMKFTIKEGGNFEVITIDSAR